LGLGFGLAGVATVAGASIGAATAAGAATGAGAGAAAGAAGTCATAREAIAAIAQTTIAAIPCARRLSLRDERLIILRPPFS